MTKIQISEGKRPIGWRKNMKYIDCYSVKFHRTVVGTMVFCRMEGVLQAHTLVPPVPTTTP